MAKRNVKVQIVKQNTKLQILKKAFLSWLKSSEDNFAFLFIKDIRSKTYPRDI